MTDLRRFIYEKEKNVTSSEVVTSLAHVDWTLDQLTYGNNFLGERWLGVNQLAWSSAHFPTTYSFGTGCRNSSSKVESNLVDWASIEGSSP